MKLINRKRVSAKEAAEILGVPYQNISRIDRQGEIIRRYKLGHKTYVYDLESLEQFLQAKEVRPIQPPVSTKRPPSRTPIPMPSKERFSLKQYLPPKTRK